MEGAGMDGGQTRLVMARIWTRAMDLVKMRDLRDTRKQNA